MNWTGMKLTVIELMTPESGSEDYFRRGKIE